MSVHPGTGRRRLVRMFRREGVFVTAAKLREIGSINYANKESQEMYTIMKPKRIHNWLNFWHKLYVVLNI